MKVFQNKFQTPLYTIEDIKEFIEEHDFSNDTQEEIEIKADSFNYVSSIKGIDIYHNFREKYYFFGSASAPTHEEDEVEKAKEVLRKHGYYTDCLWQIADVKKVYNVSDEDAHVLLAEVMEDDRIMTEINEAIDMLDCSHEDLERTE